VLQQKSQNGTLPVYATIGQVSVNSSAAVTFTQGDYVCADAANGGKVVDHLTTACPSTERFIGIVAATDLVSVPSHSIALAMGAPSPVQFTSKITMQSAQTYPLSYIAQFTAPAAGFYRLSCAIFPTTFSTTEWLVECAVLVTQNGEPAQEAIQLNYAEMETPVSSIIHPSSSIVALTRIT